MLSQKVALCKSGETEENFSEIEKEQEKIMRGRMLAEKIATAALRKTVKQDSELKRLEQRMMLYILDETGYSLEEDRYAMPEV